MQYRSLFLASLAALVFLMSSSSCRKIITVGNKPTMEFMSGPEYYLTTDSTLTQDKRYTITIKAERAEDLSPNTYFEVVRTYSGSSDTTVFDKFLTDNEQISYQYTHTFTTLKRSGKERFTFTVKNTHGITNQKILVFTVK